jgi:hypothetical protein
MVFSIISAPLKTTVMIETTGHPSSHRGERPWIRVPPFRVSFITGGLHGKLRKFAQKRDMFYGLLKIQRFFESLYQSIISLIRVVARFRFRSGARRVKAVHPELVILANGPSLRDDLAEHPDFFAGKQLMCVNQFVLTDYYEQLKPQWYILLDIGFFVGKTIPRVAEARERVKEAFIRKTTWPLTLFCPVEGRNSHFHRDLAASGIPVNFVFINRTVVDGNRPVRHWLYRLQLGMPAPQNVLIGALMASISAGFREIVILGADHSWHQGLEVGPDGRLVSAENHFYDAKPWKVAVEHPETFERATIHDYFFNLYRTFRSYHLIREFAESQKVKIVNASRVTFIDAFERRPLSSYPWDSSRLAR